MSGNYVRLLRTRVYHDDTYVVGQHYGVGSEIPEVLARGYVADASAEFADARPAPPPDPAARETAIESAEGVETADMPNGVEWTLKMDPALYLQRFPRGDYAGLARTVLEAKLERGVAGDREEEIRAVLEEGGE